MLRWLSVSLLLLLLLDPHSSLARPLDQVPNRQHQVRAKTLFMEGKTAYSAGDYEQAMAKFMAGYRLDPQSAFLINIAQSYRAAGNKEQALQYYRQFLRAEPDSSLRPQVVEILKELTAKQGPVETTPSTMPPSPVVPPVHSSPLVPEPAPATPPPVASPIYKRWWFWTAIAVAVGTGVGVATYVSRREPDYVKEGGLGAVRW